MAKCLYCNKEYTPLRATSRFCSAKCRVYYNRGLSVTDSVTKEVKPIKEVVTLKESVKKVKKMPMFCPKHGAVRIGNRYTCGCMVN